MADATNGNPRVGLDSRTIHDWTDLGPDASRATWKFDGTLRVTTSDDIAAGSDPHRT